MEVTTNTLENEAENLKNPRIMLLTELESQFGGDIIKLLRFIKDYYLESRDVRSPEIKLIKDFEKGVESIEFNREMDLLLLRQGKLKRRECPYCSEKYNEYENQETACPYCNIKD